MLSSSVSEFLIKVKIAIMTMFLEKCSYKDDMLELTILKELNLIKQMNQKNVIFVTIGVFQMKLLYVDSEIQLDNKLI